MAAACCRICRATGGHDEALGEYLAEGAIAPIVMIRRGSLKFIHYAASIPTSSTISARSGRARQSGGGSGHAAEVAAYRVGDRATLGPGNAACQVIASQRRRRFHFEAPPRGGRHSLGLAAAVRCEPAIHAQSHRPRSLEGDGAFPARVRANEQVRLFAQSNYTAINHTGMATNLKQALQVQALMAALLAAAAVARRRRSAAASRAAARRCAWPTLAGPTSTPTNAIAGLLLKALGYRAEGRESVGADHLPGPEERADRRLPRQLDAGAGAARRSRSSRASRSTCACRT